MGAFGDAIRGTKRRSKQVTLPDSGLEVTVRAITWGDAAVWQQEHEGKPQSESALALVLASIGPENVSLEELRMLSVPDINSLIDASTEMSGIGSLDDTAKNLPSATT